jgi:hypothetical protein
MSNGFGLPLSLREGLPLVVLGVFEVLVVSEVFEDEPGVLGVLEVSVLDVLEVSAVSIDVSNILNMLDGSEVTDIEDCEKCVERKRYIERKPTAS